MGGALSALGATRDRVSGALRRRRFALLESLVAPLPRPLRILDVGGTQAFWSRVGFGAARDVEIVLLNRERVAVTGPPFSSVSGDGRHMPEITDAAFDVVFSNSVLEHAGDSDDQQRMAREIRRVGRRFFVQTPNRHFPVEPHFVFPLFQFLPVTLRVHLLRRFSSAGCRACRTPPRRGRSCARSGSSRATSSPDSSRALRSTASASAASPNPSSSTVDSTRRFPETRSPTAGLGWTGFTAFEPSLASRHRQAYTASIRRWVRGVCHRSPGRLIR